MPVRQIGPRPGSPSAPHLLARLVREWQQPDPSANEPIILEERDSAQRLVHIYVVWDDWSDLEADERSQLVLEACEQVRGRAASLDVTVAMGLTRQEADRLRIPYK